jgi:hypothetical protein
MQNNIQKLENLVELYNSKTINREEFESLKKEIFTSKIMVGSAIQEPISKSVTGTIDKEKKQSEIQYSDANNKRSEKKTFAFVTFFVIIICLGGFIAFVNSNSINANNSNSTQISSPPSSTNSSNNSSNNSNRDISSYLREHTFSYDGNGSVSFYGNTIMVTGGRATLQGSYVISSSSTATFAIQAVSGDFDASNNPLCGGKIELNNDGTLTETISDGSNTRTYTLSPKN